MGFKGGGSRGAYIGAERGLGVRAQGTRRSGDPGRIRPRVLLGRGWKTTPTGGARLAVRQGGGGARWAELGLETGNGPAQGIPGRGKGSGRGKG